MLELPSLLKLPQLPHCHVCCCCCCAAVAIARDTIFVGAAFFAGAATFADAVACARPASIAAAFAGVGAGTTDAAAAGTGLLLPQLH
jgi:hypothetical protein